ncbi:hypothetical protein G7Y89_g12357 [Cudoniella acicularis]|uniref:COP9 signalosome complex subunit 3 N-terminal helical repeats domain-containing protein n=1 Tax=Cudoniella acicularis TaxID=354080 RepID=A0A8H4RCQ6_9HELO|nr:hypothetical protein G7Y89_g12357 [Cudoniella acicularis]
MDDLLPKLLSFPPHPPPPNGISDLQYDEGIKTQISTIKNIPDSKLLQQTSGGENVLDIINPALNTVPYAAVLIAHIKAMHTGNKSIDLDTIWEKILGFLGNFDPRQIRYLGSELSHIIDSTVSISRRHNQAATAIPTIRDALLRLDPTGTVLTSKHIVLMKMALESRIYVELVPFLEKSILYIPGTSSQPKPKYLCDMSLPPTAFITPGNNGFSAKIKHQDVLEYLLLNGMVCIGIRNWKKALEYLEMAVTYPAKDNSVSKIMVAAYQKWVLVGLLLTGKPLSLPKITSSGAAKLYHILAKPYESVAQIFEGGSASRLKSEAEAGKNIWHNDCNSGLIFFVLAAYQKFQIRNLAKVYSKISIPEVHNLTMSAETGAKLPNVQACETLVRSMIAEGSLHASLTSFPDQPPVLAFSVHGPVLTEKQMQMELATSTIRIKALTQEIKNTDHMLTHEKEYIKYAQKQKKNTKSMQDQGIAVTDMEWNGVEDEDLMGVF